MLGDSEWILSRLMFWEDGSRAVIPTLGELKYWLAEKEKESLGQLTVLLGRAEVQEA